MQGGKLLENSMQHNPTQNRTPFQVGLAGLKDPYSKEEKKQYVVAALFIKGKEGVHSKQQKTMEQIERVAVHQEESYDENEVKKTLGDFDIPAIKEEEDPFQIFPGDWWYESVERYNFFSELHRKLNYLQECLPYLKAMERDPKYAKMCKGPSSREVELIMQQYVPMKEEDPGSLYLDINFANGYTDQGLIDLGSSCNIMPFSIYENGDT